MVAALTAAFLAAGGSPGVHCHSPLPRGPALPAPIVVRTSCGGFRLETSGRVVRLPRGWFDARAGGTGRRFGAKLQLRRNPPGRIMILRRGQLVWRSEHLYRNDGGSIAFGPNRFAFAAYYRGVFLTDLKQPERLVVPGRGLYPYEYFPSGRLIVGGAPTLIVLSPDGRVEHRYRYRRRSGYTFDTATDTLYFVTPGGRLATVRESNLEVGRRLRVPESISFAPPGVLVFQAQRSFAVTDRDGRALAQARWRRGRLDAGATMSPDGRFVAYRLAYGKPGPRERMTLFVLTAGEDRPRAVYRHRAGRSLVCGTGASMGWHGRHLLYSSLEGQFGVVDATTGRHRTLAPLLKALPRRPRDVTPLVGWAQDFG